MKTIKTILLVLFFAACFNVCTGYVSAYPGKGWSEPVTIDEEFIDIRMGNAAPAKSGLLKSVVIDDPYKEEKEFIAQQLVKLYLIDGKSGDPEEDLVFVSYYTEDTKTSDEVYEWAAKIYFNTLYDYPELTYFVRTNVQTSYITKPYLDEETNSHYYLIAFYPQTIIPDDISTPDALKAFDKEYEDAVDAACVECFGTSDAEEIQQSGMSALEKVVAAHGWVAANCIYDPYVESGGSDSRFSPDPAVYTSYGVFVNRKAVCQGYALALKALLDRAGVDCAFVDSAPLNHAWNLVCLDNAWYHIDATWDDPGTQFSTCDGSVRYRNFLLSDEDIINTGHIPENWNTNAQVNPWSTEFDLVAAPKSKEIPNILSKSKTPITLYGEKVYLVSGATLYAFAKGSNFADPVETNLSMANYAAASAFDAESGALYLISEPTYHWFENEIAVKETGVGTQIVYCVPLKDKLPTAERVSAIDNATLYITETSGDDPENIDYYYTFYPYGIRYSEGKLFTTYDYAVVELRKEAYLDGDHGFGLYYPDDLSVDNLGGSRLDLFIDGDVTAQICLAYYAESGRMLGFDVLLVDERGVCVIDDSYALPEGTGFIQLFSVELSEEDYMVPLAGTIIAK